MGPTAAAGTSTGCAPGKELGARAGEGGRQQGVVDEGHVLVTGRIPL